MLSNFPLKRVELRGPLRRMQDCCEAEGLGVLWGLGVRVLNYRISGFRVAGLLRPLGCGCMV